MKIAAISSLGRPDPHEEIRIATDILQTVLGDFHGPVAIDLWNGKTVAGNTDNPCHIILKRSWPLRKLVLHRDIVRMAEAYLAGDIDVEGKIELLFSLGEYLEKLRLPRSVRFRLIKLALRLPKEPASAIHVAINSSRTRQLNCRSTIAHHYDISNDFYRLWLDPEMVYSCAYFANTGQSLAKAQQEKLDYICRKLRLSEGQTMLDIGCGWGALICWAARHYHVRAHGITLSEQQYAYVTARIKHERLQDSVTIELHDYRELPQDISYDRIVSVGMFEHIGVDNFPLYFGIVKKLLNPGGLFLNHGITNDTGWQDTPVIRFMNRYVFPDGELARISQVITAMEDANFEIIDVEGLRRHYALTLRHWVQALENRREQAIELVGEPTYRLRRLYMAGCAYYFEQGSSGVFQVLVGHAHQPLVVPLQRQDLYISS